MKNEFLWYFQEFRAHDRSHRQSSEIYTELNRLSNELLEHGHRFDSSLITRMIKPNETIQSILCGHSEKLAIAFHFIEDRKPSTIQLTKNLRICRDCRKNNYFNCITCLHRISLVLDQSTKLIARIRQCSIIVRDANRIHHFYPNGECSCQDYF